MGEVHNAFDERHQRYVALKLLSWDVSADAGLRARFQREAEIVASLRHPHVIPVHGYGEIDGRLYLDMRLVDGSDLATVLEGGCLSPARSIDLVGQVAGALDAAHDEGLVHRDVKPSNVLISGGSGTYGFAYLCDFGIARSIDATALTTDEIPAGTLAYMAPERFRGGPPAISGDIYALTCLLYECLTGQRPFGGGDLPDLLYAHLDQPPPKPSVVNPDVPIALDAVIARGLAKDPAERYRSASDLAAAAQAALDADGTSAPSVSPKRIRRRRVPRKALIPAVLTAAALVVGVAAFAHRPSSGLTTLGENSVGLVHTGSGRLARSIAVDAGPTAVASGFGAVWTANTNADTVSRIDLGTGDVTRILVQSGPSAIAVGADSVWVTNGGAGTVTRIDPSNDRTQTITVGTAPGGVAFASGAVWVANTGDGSVSRIDPARNNVVKTIAVGASPGAISAGSDIWVANSVSNTVSRIDPAANSVVQTIPVGNDPEGIRVVGDAVWVANHLDGTISRISTAATSQVTTLSLESGAQPTGFADSAGKLWVLSSSNEALDEIDITGSGPRLVRTLPLGVVPSAVTSVDRGDSLWVTGTIDPARHRGGIIRIRDAAPDSIDPSYSATRMPAGLFNGTYDGLVGVRHASGAKGAEIVADLASALPTPTNGGLTYTFHLRNGIQWSDGRPLTVFDVRRGLERAVLFGGSSIGSEIVGAQDCTAANCEISGITVDTPANTVTVQLVQPNPGFLGQIATWCPAVPADTPLAEQTSVPVPATGPYLVASYSPGKSIALRRNPYFHQWSEAAQPAGYPDGIDYEIAPGGSSIPAAEARTDVANVEAGRDNWADGRFAATASELSARFGDRLHLSSQVSTNGVALNTRIAPFNDVRVRRALNLAVDRAAAVAAWPSVVTPTCQILPPGSPGYLPYCPYTLHPTSRGLWDSPDIVTAQQLVASSGTKGMRVTLWTLPNVAAGIQPVVDSLRNLGYQVNLKVGDPGGDFFGYVDDSRNKVQAAFVGWHADDPDSGHFIVPLFACDSFKANDPMNTNFSQFCDSDVQGSLNKARELETTSRPSANELWAQADKRITDASAWVPLVNESWADTVSSRVHNYMRNPYIGVLFDQMWLT